MKATRIFCFISLIVIFSINAQQPAFCAETKVSGTIVEKSGNTILIRDYRGTETQIQLTSETEIKEKKMNFLRKANSYSPDQLLLGLNIEVKGKKDQTGILRAEEIKFTQDDLEVAETVTSQVAPLEVQIDQTQKEIEAVQSRLDETQKERELAEEKMQSEIEELGGAFETARSEARDAKATANRALSRIEDTNDRINEIDDYKEEEISTILFGLNSTEISDEAKTTLGSLAGKYKDRGGYLIEVIGFASSDGNEEYNRKLSKERAEEVVRFLTEDQQIPLRRIITPHGYGEKNPIGDNSTKQGREKNRRVQVRVLLSRALAKN